MNKRQWMRKIISVALCLSLVFCTNLSTLGAENNGTDGSLVLTKKLNEVTVTLTADPGVFPADKKLELSVSRVSGADSYEVAEAIENYEKGETQNIDITEYATLSEAHTSDATVSEIEITEDTSLQTESEDESADEEYYASLDGEIEGDIEGDIEGTIGSDTEDDQEIANAEEGAEEIVFTLEEDIQQPERYVYDICVLADGVEVQPNTEAGSTYVSFTLNRELGEDEIVEVYHIHEDEDNTLQTQELDVIEDAPVAIKGSLEDLFVPKTTISVETDGFSYYALVFYDNDRTEPVGFPFSMDSKGHISITELLNDFMLASDLTIVRTPILDAQSGASGLRVELKNGDYFLEFDGIPTGTYIMHVYYSTSTSSTSAKNINFKIECNGKKYVSVTYDTNGGSKIQEEPLVIETDVNGEVVPDPEMIPLKAGWVFNKWYYIDNGVQKDFYFSNASQPTKIYEDTTIYAEWVRNELAQGNAWYKGSMPKSDISSITFMCGDVVEPEIPGDPIESWDASANEAYSITAFVDKDGNLTLVGNGDRIALPANCHNTFRDFANLKSIDGLDAVDASNAQDCSCMFAKNASLASLDLSQWDMSSATNMSYMFYGCKSLTEVKLPVKKEGAATGTLNNMQSMFYECTNLQGADISGLDTSGVTNMRNLFYGCSGLTSVNLNGFNTAAVTDMAGMFCNCTSLATIDLSGFNTKKVKDMSYMFAGCGASSINLSAFDVSSVTNMKCMFFNSKAQTLVLEGFNTSNVTDASFMFYKCGQLQVINVKNDFDTSNMTTYTNMFAKCDKLIGANGTGYSDAHAGKLYARVDNNTQKGYFR